MLEWGGIFPKWIRTTRVSLNIFPLPFSPRAVDRLWVLVSNALPHCQTINWINVSWCLFGEDVHCIWLWYLNRLHNPFSFVRPRQQFSRILDTYCYLKPGVSRALSTRVNLKEKGKKTLGMFPALVFSVFLSLGSLIFGCYCQLLWPHLRVCARHCVEEVQGGRNERGQIGRNDFKRCLFSQLLKLTWFCQHQERHNFHVFKKQITPG